MLHECEKFLNEVMKVHLFSRQVATYFWFLGDLFIVCLFAISFTTAYRYIHQRRKLESHGVYSELQIQHRLRRSIYKHVMCKSFRTAQLTMTTHSRIWTSTKSVILYGHINSNPRRVFDWRNVPHAGLSPDYCGTLPFSFLSWGAYSVYLVCKIGVIFSSQIPAFMTDFEGTQSREGE